MRNWLRKLIGIDTVDKIIVENNYEIQSKLENISRLLESKNYNENKELAESISSIELSYDSGLIEFKLDNSLTLDENWALLKSNNQNENIFTLATGASAIAASTASTNGLYTATVSANSLMTYSNGTLSSITMNGSKFGQHAGFVSANAAVFTPILAFQFASMITGQYYFNGLSQQLTSIHDSINNLISLHHNERLAKLRYINYKIYELSKRTYFTLEDFITIDKLKYELSTIRYGYLLTAEQEINKSLDKINNDNNKTIDIISEDTNLLERAKLSIKEDITRFSSSIADKFNNLYQDSLFEKGIDGFQKLTENSSKKATKLTSDILESKYFFYSDISLKAEHLYQLSKLLELKMNLSFKESDLNRIGKIKELYSSVLTFNKDDSIFDEIQFINSQIKSKLTVDINKLKDNSFTNKNKILANGKKIEDKLYKSEELITQRNVLFNDIEKIKLGFEKTNQIIIDNRNGKSEVYVKTIANQ